MVVKRRKRLEVVKERRRVGGCKRRKKVVKGGEML